MGYYHVITYKELHLVRQLLYGGMNMFESNDTFVEEAVKVVESGAMKAKKLCLLAATLLFCVAMISTTGIIKTILAILTIVAGLSYCWILGYKNIEYEYDYTNGSLEIAKIINNEKRKKVVSIEPSEVKLVAAVGTNESLKYDHVNLKTYDCSSNQEDDKDYILVAHSEPKGYDFKVIFNPSEKLLNAMSKYNKHEIYA